MRPLARVIISKHSDADDYGEHIQAKWRKLLRHIGGLFSPYDQYGNDIDGLTISLEPARAG